jgi:4'-phosphopantetheinyl transferase
VIHPSLFLSKDIPGDQGLLGPSELKRLASLKAPKRQEQFLRSHSLMQLALGSLLPRPAQGFEIESQPDAPPRLGSGPLLSLSHSGGICACLLSPQAPCGIDVEDSSRERDFKALAGKAFEGEAATGAGTKEAFYKAWCLKEARFKTGKRNHGGHEGLFQWEGFQGALVLPEKTLEICIFKDGNFEKSGLKLDWL